MRAAQVGTLLFAFWLLLTASMRPFDLAVGIVLSVVLGTWASRRLWGSEAPTLSVQQAVRVIAYVPFLIKEIIVATIYVAEKVLDPRMPIDPVIISHRCKFERDVSRVAFANSITLTPGTLTVDVDHDTFVIHCLNEGFADSIASGSLERRISRVFEE